MGNLAERKETGRPAHPAKNQVGAEGPDLAPQGRSGGEVKTLTKGELYDRHAGRLEPGRARGMAPDHGPLLEASPGQRRQKALEEGFGAADPRAGHDVKHAQAHSPGLLNH